MRFSGSTLLLLAVAIVVLSVGDGSDEDCDKILEPYGGKVMTGFDANKYMGVWYEVASYGMTPDGSCISEEYILSGINSMTVHNRNYKDGGFVDTIGSASLVYPSCGNAILTLQFIPDKPEIKTPYCVVSTNYESYSIAWECSQDKDDKYTVDKSWILSRNVSYTDKEWEQFQKNVSEALEAVGLELKYETTEHNPDVCIVTECSKTPLGNTDTPFDASKYLGVWYEIARSGQTDFEEGGQCITAEYTLSGINDLTINYTMYSTKDKTFKDTVSWAKFEDPTTGQAKLTTNFTGVEAPYWVLDTDYETYSIVWSCIKSKGKAETESITETSWILSRSAQLTPEKEQEVKTKLLKLGLTQSSYEKVLQDPQQCVVSNSVCDKSALTDFEMAQYVGTWYEIARFGEAPLEEGGLCIVTNYTLSTPNKYTVDSEMYSKDARAFKHITGWAELEDQEAKLTVHYPSISAETSYLVLATDYYNYAIIWTCSDSDSADKDSTESSWILSRTETLTSDVEKEVNTKLDELGLPRTRYTNTEQDKTQCVASQGSACGQSALTGFEMYQYVGTWYEIARYGEAPLEEGGQCITVTYTLTVANNMSVHNKIFSKDVRAFKEITGWAELDNPDSKEAKLTVHFPSVGETVSYLILDTDYENYSILWSCSDSDSEAEASNTTGNSWLLSRKNVMSEDLKKQVDEKLKDLLGLSLDDYTLTPQDEKDCRPKASKGGAAALGPAVALSLASAAALLFSV